MGNPADVRRPALIGAIDGVTAPPSGGRPSLRDRLRRGSSPGAPGAAVALAL
jgi:hypothetical protein